MKRPSNFWMYRSPISASRPLDSCITIVVGAMKESATGLTRYYAGCSWCGTKVLDYDRAKVEAVVEEHNGRVK